MKNIHILPTDKPSRLCLDSKGVLLFAPRSGYFTADGKQNIYITSSDEEIKEGDWFLDDNNSIGQSYKLSHVQFANPKKIILTTDFDKQPRVQAIPDEFLEWFVKNPSCEEVEVEKESHIEIEEVSYEGDFQNVEYINYKIIIPSEEPKQETIEEAAIKRYGSDQYLWAQQREGFIEGYKLAQERMYSEEDMIKFAIWIYLEVGSNTRKDRTNEELFKEWIFKFKKKQSGE